MWGWGDRLGGAGVVVASTSERNTTTENVTWDYLFNCQVVGLLWRTRTFCKMTVKCSSCAKNSVSRGGGQPKRQTKEWRREGGAPETAQTSGGTLRDCNGSCQMSCRKWGHWWVGGVCVGESRRDSSDRGWWLKPFPVLYRPARVTSVRRCRRGRGTGLKNRIVTAFKHFLPVT